MVEGCDIFVVRGVGLGEDGLGRLSFVGLLRVGRLGGKRHGGEVVEEAVDAGKGVEDGVFLGWGCHCGVVLRRRLR